MLRACSIALLPLAVGLFAVPPHLMADAFTFTTIDFPGSTITGPSGINDGGQIVGSYTDQSGVVDHGFLLSGGIFSTIDFPGSNDTFDASGINNSGQIVGSYQGAGLGL